MPFHPHAILPGRPLRALVAVQRLRRLNNGVRLAHTRHYLLTCLLRHRQQMAKDRAAAAAQTAGKDGSASQGQGGQAAQK